MMKTRFIIFHIILLLAISQSVFCQSECLCPGTEKINTEPYLSGELFTPDVPLDNMTYFNNSWLPGDIFLEDGGIIKNKRIKYNGLADELFCLDPAANQVLKLDKSAICQFHYLNFNGDTSVYFRKLKVKRNLLPDSTEIYAQEIYRGDLSLYVLHNFFLARREKIAKNKVYVLKDIYIEDPVYYMKFLNNEIVEFKRFSRKSIYALAPGKEVQIRKFFRESVSGRIKTNQEITGLMQFLNTIIEK